MQYLGIEFSLKNQPRLDGSFIPFGVWERAYLKGAEKPFKIAVEREGGLVSVFETKLRGPEFAEANYRYAERFVKMLLWRLEGHALRRRRAGKADAGRIPRGRQARI